MNNFVKEQLKTAGKSISKAESRMSEMDTEIYDQVAPVLNLLIEGIQEMREAIQTLAEESP